MQATAITVEDMRQEKTNSNEPVPLLFVANPLTLTSFDQSEVDSLSELDLMEAFTFP